MTSSTSSTSSTGSLLHNRDRFLDTWRREHETTTKVLRAFPAAQSEFRPHERSSTAHRLAWTFVVEERLMLQALRGELKLGGGFPVPPESWDAVLAELDRARAELDSALQSATEQQLGGTTHFFVAPKQTGDIPVMDFLWFLLHDQIHHRGQLSVYLRMTGGKVPSIYGPTADEPWN